MSDLAFTRINSNNATDNAAMKVWLWDLGPKKPEPPMRPKAPKGSEGEPEYDLAMLEFREAMEDYATALKAHKQAKVDYAEFEKRSGGPIELFMWSADANDALTRDPKRYVISSRTRGYEKLKNRGLPVGVTPGHGHAENMRREIEANADLAAAMRADPVFGEQETRP
jgi:hypothetical protein